MHILSQIIMTFNSKNSRTPLELADQGRFRKEHRSRSGNYIRILYSKQIQSESCCLVLGYKLNAFNQTTFIFQFQCCYMTLMVMMKHAAAHSEKQNRFFESKSEKPSKQTVHTLMLVRKSNVIALQLLPAHFLTKFVNVHFE